MEQVGNSKLWVKKYAPKTFKDLIIPDEIRNFLNHMLKDGESHNLLFFGPPGTGKTSTAKAIARELGEEPLYINGSEKTSIDDVRYELKNFATSVSLVSNGKKIAILDEFDRLSVQAMDSLKGLIEEAERNCRFIFITNNVHKVTKPVTSRTKEFSYGVTEKEKEALMTLFFKRMKHILELEEVEYDKKSLGLFIKKMYPDFRKIIEESQSYYYSHGKIDEGILKFTDENKVSEVVELMKQKKAESVRKEISNIDPDSFYRSFYEDIKKYIDPSSIPDVIATLAEYAHTDTQTIDREINLAACVFDLMRKTKWKT